jgi:hypothetical protein
MKKIEDRIDLDVAEAFEVKLQANGWRRQGDLHVNYANDRLIRHNSYAANAFVHYELQISDALAIDPNGKSGTTAHAMGVLDELRDYAAKAELEVLKKRIKERKEASGEKSG